MPFSFNICIVSLEVLLGTIAPLNSFIPTALLGLISKYSVGVVANFLK